MQQTSVYKTLTTIFYGFLSAMVMFGFIFYFLVASGNTNADSSLTSTMLLVAIILAVGGVFGGNVLYKKRVEEALTKTSATEKLEVYKGAVILRLAMIEGPYLFALISYFFTGNVQFVYLGALLLIVYLLQKPSRDKIAVDLQLNEDEKQLL